MIILIIPLFLIKNNTMIYCNNIFSLANFWNINVVNSIFIIFYFIIVLTCYIISCIYLQTYHKAVYIVLQNYKSITKIILNITIMITDTCILCYISICYNIYIILSLIIIFLNILDLWIICIDIGNFILYYRLIHQSAVRKKEIFNL